MDPTPVPELNQLLRELTDSVHSALGDCFVAAVLQGSFAVGDFDEHSDADFVVAVRDRLTDAQVGALQTLHGRIRDLPNPWAAHLEGSYFPVEVLRTCDRRLEPLWYLDHGHRVMVPGTHCNTAVVRQVVRQHGIRLAGAEPASLVDPVPVEILGAEIYTVMGGWGREIIAKPEVWATQFYQGFIALNYCRAWCDLVTGTVGSKRRGAEWAKGRLPAAWAELIDRSWATRIDPAKTSRTPADPVEYRMTLEFLAWLVAEWDKEFVSHRASGVQIDG